MLSTTLAASYRVQKVIKTEEALAIIGGHVDEELLLRDFVSKELNAKYYP